jgi:hypothetical protein
VSLACQDSTVLDARQLFMVRWHTVQIDNP